MKSRIGTKYIGIAVHDTQTRVRETSLLRNECQILPEWVYVFLCWRIHGEPEWPAEQSHWPQYGLAAWIRFRDYMTFSGVSYTVRYLLGRILHCKIRPRRSQACNELLLFRINLLQCMGAFRGIRDWPSRAYLTGVLLSYMVAAV